VTDELSADGQEPEDNKPQEGEEPTDDTQEGAAEADPAELARLRKELKETRKEAASNRVKLKQYEDEKLTEQQKLEQERNQASARADQLEARVRDLQAEVAAAKLGVRAEAVGDVSRLIDWDQVEDASDSKQVERAVRDLIKERPYLSGRPGGLDGGTPRGSGRKVTSMTDLIRQAAGR
jgi:chromosome segregation ATPase